MHLSEFRECYSVVKVLKIAILGLGSPAHMTFSVLAKKREPGTCWMWLDMVSNYVAVNCPHTQSHSSSVSGHGVWEKLTANC